MTHEIILNHLTMNEFARHKDSFGQYTKEVVTFFNMKGRFHYEKALLTEYKETTIDDLTSKHPDKFVPAGRRREKGDDEFENAWFDIGEYYIIKPEDPMYDLFFVYTLRNLDILETDTFLNYQQTKYFENEPEKFKRFLHLIVRKYGKELLSLDQVETISEWTSPFKTQQEGSVLGVADRTKGKLRREAGDNLTALNLQQIALLIHFMQEARIILKDEYLNKTQCGQAFSLLTGYSPDALRLELNPEKFNLSKENLTGLQNVVTKLGILIKNTAPKK